MLICAVLLWFAVWLNWKRFRDYLYPGFIQALLWALVLSWFLFAHDEFDAVSASTILLLTSGVVAFTVGCRIFTAGHKPVTGQSPKFSVSTRTKWAVGLVPIAALPFFIRRATDLASGGGPGNFLVALRYQLGVQQEGYGLFVVAMWMAYASVALSLLEISSSDRRIKATLWFLLLTTVSLVYAVLFAGRNWVFFLIIILFGIPMILRVVPPRLGAVIIGSSALALFAAYAFLLGSMGLSETYSLADAFSILYHTAALYALGPIVALDQVVRQSRPWEFGFNVFHDFEAFLNLFGFRIAVKPVVQEWTSVPDATNIYTAYLPYYLDFGFVGATLFQLFAGFWHGYLYKRATQPDAKPIFILLFGIFLYPLLMQYSVDAYMIGLNRWVIFTGIFSILLFPPSRVSSTSRKYAPRAA